MQCSGDAVDLILCLRDSFLSWCFLSGGFLSDSGYLSIGDGIGTACLVRGLLSGCFLSWCSGRWCFLCRLFGSRGLFLLRGCGLLGNLCGLLLFFCHFFIVLGFSNFYFFWSERCIYSSLYMTVLNFDHSAWICSNGSFLLIIQRGHVFLLFLILCARLFFVGLVSGKPCCWNLLVGQFKHSLDGAVVVTDLIHQDTHHLLRIEGLAGQVLFLHQRTVLSDGLAELLTQLVQLGLQFLRLTIYCLSVLCILVRTGHANQLNVAVSVLVNRPVGNAPEGTHRTDTAHCVTSVHHNRAIAQRSNQLTG